MNLCSEKPYKSGLTKLNMGISLEPISKEVDCQGTLVPYNGDCSLMVERVVVVRKKRVRSSPFTLLEKRV